jgi:hypothetical protein
MQLINTISYIEEQAIILVSLFGAIILLNYLPIISIKIGLARKIQEKPVQQSIDPQPLASDEPYQQKRSHGVSSASSLYVKMLADDNEAFNALNNRRFKKLLSFIPNCY